LHTAGISAVYSQILKAFILSNFIPKTEFENFNYHTLAVDISPFAIKFMLFYLQVALGRYFIGSFEIK